MASALGREKILTPLPDGKVIIWRPETDEYSEAIKIVDGAYDLREYPYDESYLDDIEDNAYDYDSDNELMHPDDVEANYYGMEDDEDDEYEGSDNSGEYIVDRAGNTIGRRHEEDESDDEVRANFQSMAMNS